jgi:hypothetical protein
MIPDRLVLATGNPGKVDELRGSSGSGGTWSPSTCGVSRRRPAGGDRALVCRQRVAKARAVAEATGSPGAGGRHGARVDALAGEPGVPLGTLGGAGRRRCGAHREAPSGRSPASPNRGRTARFPLRRGARVARRRALETAEGRCDGTDRAAAGGARRLRLRSGVRRGRARTLARPATSVEKQRISHRRARDASSSAIGCGA